MTKDPANFREYAGTLTAFIICISYIAIGFVQIAVSVFHGASITIPGDWMSAMLSLASAALGYLIGKQTAAPILSGVASAQLAVKDVSQERKE